MAEMVEDGIPVWDPNEALQEAIVDWVPDNTEVSQGSLWIQEVRAHAETNEEEDALVEQREADQSAATETETADTEGAQLRKLWTKYADSTPEISYKSKYSYYHRPQSLQRVCLGRIDMLGHVHKCTCNIHYPACVIFISSMAADPQEINNVLHNWLIAADDGKLDGNKHKALGERLVGAAKATLEKERADVSAQCGRTGGRPSAAPAKQVGGSSSSNGRR